MKSIIIELEEPLPEKTELFMQDMKIKDCKDIYMGLESFAFKRQKNMLYISSFPGIYKKSNMQICFVLLILTTNFPLVIGLSLLIHSWLYDSPWKYYIYRNYND